MNKTITITMDASLNFKFLWTIDGIVSHVGIIVDPEDRNGMSGVCRLGAGKKIVIHKEVIENGKVVKNEVVKWEDQIILPKWLKNAIDYAFIAYADRITAGSKFTIQANDLGMKPVVAGLPEDVIDRSWMNDLPQNKSTVKKEKTSAVDKANVEEKKADCLNQLRAMTKNREMSTANA